MLFRKCCWLPIGLLLSVCWAYAAPPETAPAPAPVPGSAESAAPAAPGTPAPATPPPAPGATPTPAATPLPSNGAVSPKNFTPPSIEALLGQLRALEPLPFEKVWRNPPDHPPQERTRLAFLTGRMIADGFLVVAAERSNRVEPVGRSLMRMAESLGFGAKIRARGKAVIDKAKKERWAEARLELVLTQSDADAALRALNDEELVILVALGGWLRGLEITATSVADYYTPQRSAQIWQPELAKAFYDRLQTFHPSTRGKPVVILLSGVLADIAGLVGEKHTLEKSEVEHLRAVTRAANDAITSE